MATLKNLFIELTTACNFKCEMCDIWQTKRQFLPFKLLSKVLRQARELGADQVSFSGGEALLHPNFQDALKLAKTLGFNIFISTNGSLISAQNVGFLVRHVDHIGISIEGDKKTHEQLRGPGSYDKALMAIRLLKNKRILTSLSMVVSKKSFQKMRSLVDLANQEKIYQIIFQPFGRGLLFKRAKDCQNFWITKPDLENLEKEIEETISYAKRKKVDILSESLLRAIPKYFALDGRIYPKRSCQIAQTSLVLRKDGKIIPCWGWYEPVLGDIKKNSLREIYYGSKRKLILKKIEQKKCPGCLAACSDIEAYGTSPKNQLALLAKRMRNIYRISKIMGLSYSLSLVKSAIARKIDQSKDY